MKGRHLALLGLLVTIVLGVAVRSLDPQSIPPYSDYWDYLQLGRQLSEGHGFSSLFTYPLFLDASVRGPQFPLLWRPPLFPALVGGVFVLTGPSAWVPLFLQVAGYLAAVLGAYLLALEFVKGRWALLAAVVTALSPHVLGLFEPGIATAVYTAALTFGFLIAVRATTRRRAAWAGIYFGILVLLRAETLVVGPAIVWMLWAGERGDRESRIWHFLLAGIVVLFPWTIRTWIVTGKPFTNTSSLLFTDTPVFPGWESSRRLDTLRHSALLWAVSHPADMTLKSLKNLYHFLRQALLMPLPALAPFVWAALGRLTRVGRESAFCAALLIAIVLFTVILSPLEYAPRFLHPFIPALTVVGVIVLSRFREDRGETTGAPSLTPGRAGPAAWAAFAVVTLAGLEMVGSLAAAHRERRGQVRLDQARPGQGVDWSEVSRSIPPGDWAMADYPAYYAWQTRSRFVWLPVMRDLTRVARAGGRLRTIVLARERGAVDPDPTGIPPTPALAESLEARGWRAREVGPLLVLEDGSGSP